MGSAIFREGRGDFIPVGSVLTHIASCPMLL